MPWKHRSKSRSKLRTKGKKDKHTQTDRNAEDRMRDHNQEGGVKERQNGEQDGKEAQREERQKEERQSNQWY